MDDIYLLSEQAEYYRARAGEYDEWVLRRGRYDRGPEHRAEWLGEVGIIARALEEAALSGDVVELACGTGWWTRRLAGPTTNILAVDSSVEVIDINRQSIGSARAAYVVGDIFSLPVRKTFDAVFFSFWLSHVPPSRFEQFWDIVRRLLKPDGRVFFVDSLLEQTSTARDHGALSDSGVVRRRLNDGREFDIVKVFYDPAGLHGRLQKIGWDGWVLPTGRFFLHGLLSPTTVNAG
jgi:ubiquinone/menaquinone biosynthesis C-methylase UbiE